MENHILMYLLLFIRRPLVYKLFINPELADTAEKLFDATFIKDALDKGILVECEYCKNNFILIIFIDMILKVMLY